MKTKKNIYRSVFFISILMTFLILGKFNGMSQELENLPVKEMAGGEFYVYEAKKGETLYGVSKKYGWDLEELVKINPEVNLKLERGEKVYYPKKNNAISSSTNLSGNTIFHTVKKGETVYSISRKYNVPLDVIYKSNPSAKSGVKPGEVLEISGATQDITVNKEEPSKNEKENSKKIVDNNSKESSKINKKETTQDKSKNNSLGIKSDAAELSMENQPYLTVSSDNAENVEIIEDTFILSDTIPEPILKLALILDDPNSKKDIDFTRGSLISLSNYTTSEDLKIDLKVIDGRRSSGDIIEILDIYEPDYIISTADKAFPLFLADYGNSNNVKVVNMFDLRNDLYEDNPSIIQILPPSQYFNEKVSASIYSGNKYKKLIAVGEEDVHDAIATELLKMYEDSSDVMSLEDFGSLEPEPATSLLIYSYANKKEDVGDFLNNVENLATNFPGLDYNVVGRGSWIAMIDDFGDKFEEFNIIIPSRVWLDTNSEDWKKFNRVYEESFEGGPVRSIPNYAASGYDLTNYIISEEIDLRGLSSSQLNSYPMLQTDFNLISEGDWKGKVNGISYLIKFKPGIGTEKVIL